MTTTGGLFQNNQAEDSGGGFYNDTDGSVTLSNLTFTNNNRAQAGGGVYVLDGTVVLYSCILRGNSASVANGGNGGSWVANQGLISCTCFGAPWWRQTYLVPVLPALPSLAERLSNRWCRLRTSKQLD